MPSATLKSPAHSVTPNKPSPAWRASNRARPTTFDLLLDFQQALEQNGHYSGASVQADFDRLQGDRVPVKVSVTEVKRHKLETGIRLDSEYGLGGKIAYDYYNLFNKGYIGSVVWDMDKYETTLAAGISQPRNYRGNYWTSNVSYNRSTTQNLEKRAFSGGIWYVRDRAGIDARLGAEFLAEGGKSPARMSIWATATPRC